MAPVALPPQLRRVNLPNPPSDPPTAVDLAEALCYKNNILESYYRDRRSEDVARGYKDALDYEKKISAAMEGDAVDNEVPQWFNALERCIQEFTGQMTQMRTEFTGQMTQMRTEFTGQMTQMRTEFAGEMTRMRTDIAQVGVQLTQMNRKIEQINDHGIKTNQLAARIHNSRLYDESSTPFEIVIMNDGKHPVMDKELPPLVTKDDIESLTGENLKKYCQGYGIPLNLAASNKRKRVKDAVGAQY